MPAISTPQTLPCFHAYHPHHLWQCILPHIKYCTLLLAFLQWDSIHSRVLHLFLMVFFLPPLISGVSSGLDRSDRVRRTRSSGLSTPRASTSFGLPSFSCRVSYSSGHSPRSATLVSNSSGHIPLTAPLRTNSARRWRDKRAKFGPELNEEPLSSFRFDALSAAPMVSLLPLHL